MDHNVEHAFSAGIALSTPSVPSHHDLCDDAEEPPSSQPAASAAGLVHLSSRQRGAPPALRADKDSSAPPGGLRGEFRSRFFPKATDVQWNDWKWHLRNRIRDLAGLERVFELTDEERSTVQSLGGGLPVGITPYYASVFEPGNHRDPLRRTMIPLGGELITSPGESDDPLSENDDMPVPGLVHRYPDRVLFLVTTFCATYCRYCTRSRLVGKTGEIHFNKEQFERVLDYLRGATEVRDVLLSGGDALTMEEGKLDWLLGELHAIPHIEFVRIGSKVPAVLPQRITPELCSMLKKHHPLWMSIHFMHPNEVTPEVHEACGRLADAGIPLGAQIVLAKDVNDDVDTMKELVHRLLKARVRPYYLYQGDPISGSAHFRTPVSKGLEIIEGLRGHTTGYAVPTFVIDAPGGGGKIPLMPDSVVGRDGDDLLVRNYEGKIFRYPDPQPGATPELVTIGRASAIPHGAEP